ncbi:exonuclease domain-containing protein [Kurthia sibirica]|uniref:DNA polymerase III subunit epsilon n=1 Tax=Kurthia sibirica TaxID=202750 RepID=A0A2U3AIJ4_9BACL|nr:exonuclease domain-containing protein [Kurthia sibirica]PWI24376.1 DNA polymerase III subunit epsilon [Kurthia sibirica]GEK33793.1 hypothetical protein KSI01_13260 [Kurthia sibirica]
MNFEGFSQMFNGVMNRNSMNRMHELQSKEQIAYLRRLDASIRLDRDFSRPFDEVEFVVFDLETTGFEPVKGDEIVSVGAIKIKGSELLSAQFYSLSKIQGWISPKIEALTSITNKQVANALPAKDVLDSFIHFIGESTLIAHHAKHERDFMDSYYKKIYQKKFIHRIVDTSFLLKVTGMNNPYCTLDEACQTLNIPIENRHHALGDAVMTAKVWTSLIGRLQEQGIENLEQLYSRFAEM